MKTNLLKSIFIITIMTVSTLSAQAQQRGSPSVAPAKRGARTGGGSQFRILAQYDYVMASPGELNNFLSNIDWSGTKVPANFNALNGFTLGAGFLMGPGFLGLEYSYGLQELSKTNVPPLSTVQYSMDYQTVYLTYDWVFNRGKHSYELGLGAGYALKFQNHWLASSGGVDEEVIWQDNPAVFKARANYNYNLSSLFKLRIGATYEMASSTNMKADSTHGSWSIVKDQPLRDGSGQNIKVDISGLRLSAGLILAF